MNLKRGMISRFGRIKYKPFFGRLKITKLHDIRAIINGIYSNKTFSMTEGMESILQAFKMKSEGIELSKEDYFYAGYILSNPIMREKLMKWYKAEMKIKMNS